MPSQRQKCMFYIFSQQLQNKTLSQMRLMCQPKCHPSLKRLCDNLSSRLQTIRKHYRLVLLQLQVRKNSWQWMSKCHWMSHQNVLRPVFWQLLKLSFRMHNLQRINLHQLFSWLFLVCFTSGYLMQKKEPSVCLQRSVCFMERYLFGEWLPKLANDSVQNYHCKLQSLPI